MQEWSAVAVRLAQLEVGQIAVKLAGLVVPAEVPEEGLEEAPAVLA